MPISRKYTPQEILKFLQAAENQKRTPSTSPAHSLGQHLYITKDGLRTRVVDEVKEQATRFASEEDIVGAVYEAFNSATGQSELAKLDNNSENRVVITHTVVGNYEAEGRIGDLFTFPFAADFPGSSKDKKKALEANTFAGDKGGTGITKVLEVKVIVDKQDANTPWIQTAYPSRIQV